MTLGARPPGDSLARDLARTKIAGALFGAEEHIRIGRYQILARAGAGGMGVVWSAWDPELERRVAIKLVRFAAPLARERMLREGQALAKLSHPNVVPIYDVGTIGDQIYLVMEWIAGSTLRELGRVPAKLALERYRAAGAGLVAAHRAGIVHRDFKPDNVMVGDDGRVRVLDFGLARTDAVATGGGTARYMAPEQAAGQVVTAAVDQYSFCVALAESLGHPPAWVAAIVARGTAAAPDDRFRDLEALLAALARDPARRWRRRGLAVAGLAVAATAFVVGDRRHAEPGACTGAEDELARVWNPARAVQMVAHTSGLGTYGTLEARALAGRVAEYGERWVDARHGACLAERRGEVTPQIYERGLACLERARAALDATTEALGRTTTTKLSEAVLAVRDLPEVEGCLTSATVDAVAPPGRGLAAVVAGLDDQVTRAQYLALAADPDALPLAHSTTRAAQRVGYGPLVARANLALGAALSVDASTTGDAAAAYAIAADAALAAGADALFVEAFARELYAAVKTDVARVATLVPMATFVATIAKRSGVPGTFARALFYNNMASARLALGDRSDAIAWLRQASAEPDLAEHGAELAAILGNLAMLVDDRGERASLFAEERSRLERTLGANHALTLETRMREADFLEDPLAVATVLREACSKYTALFPHRRDRIARCHYELGWLAAARGDVGEERGSFGIAATLLDPDEAALAGAELARLTGDDRSAIQSASRLAVAAEARGAWWERFDAADAWMVVAAARAHLGERNRAIEAVNASLAVLADPRMPRAPHVERRIARARAELARLHPVVRDQPFAAAAIAE